MSEIISNSLIQHFLSQENNLVHEYTVGGLSLLDYKNKRPYRNYHFLKCSGGCVEKGRCYNAIEIENERIDFSHSLFVSHQFPITANPLSTLQFHEIICVKFALWTKENNHYFLVNDPITESLELKNNPFYLGVAHHGRKRSMNPYLSLLFKHKRSDYMVNCARNRKVKLYLQVTLINQNNECFSDYTRIFFRKKLNKIQKQSNNNINCNSNNSINLTNNNNINLTNNNNDTCMDYPPVCKPIPPYRLNSISPSEGKEGDVVTLQGKFPQQDKLQIIFGIHKLSPSLSFENSLQCIVPPGFSDQKVSVSIAYENIRVTEPLVFHFIETSQHLSNERKTESQEINVENIDLNKLIEFFGHNLENSECY